MTITENTPARLIIEDVPWRRLVGMLGFMSIWIAGSIVFILQREPGGAVAFLGLGTVIPMIVLWFTVRRNQLVFDRAAGTVEHRSRSFRGFTRQPFRIDQIERIYIGQNGPKRGTLFIEVTGGMDAGHHAFPIAPVDLIALGNAKDVATAWLAP